MAYGRQPASKSTTMLELCRIMPANSLPSMRTLQQTTWALCQHILQPRSHRPASISHMLPSLTSSFSSCYVICCCHSVDAQRSLCDDDHGDGSSCRAATRIIAFGKQVTATEYHVLCLILYGFNVFHPLAENFVVCTACLMLVVRTRSSSWRATRAGQLASWCRHCVVLFWGTNANSTHSLPTHRHVGIIAVFLSNTQ